MQLRVGFANEIHKTIPPGLQVTCPDQTHVVIKGCDKQQVGQFAAEVRAVRKPEPYKGKGHPLRRRRCEDQAGQGRDVSAGHTEPARAAATEAH